MAIGKPRGKDGMRPVYVYDPAIGRKRYVGSRKALRGDGGAQALERAKTDEFAGRTRRDGTFTIGAYALDWLELHHGPNTRRPAPQTRVIHEYSLRPFLSTYGDRALDGGVARRAALAWAKKHPNNAKVVSAMFNDAVDEEICGGNPFANRRQTQSRGRKDIRPITEDEVELLVAIAHDIWGEGYGRVAAGWITFAAWVGCRPGETFGVELADLDYRAGEVTIRRVKPRGDDRHPVDVIVFPRIAQDRVRAMPDIPTAGPIFRTITGKPITKGSQRYVWDPIRKAFELRLTLGRRAELLAGRADLDFYELRHFCGSLMADRGASEHDIAHQLGNSVEVCREHYIHAYRDRTNDRVRNALDGGGTVTPITAARRTSRDG